MVCLQACACEHQRGGRVIQQRFNVGGSCQRARGDALAHSRRFVAVFEFVATRHACVVPHNQNTDQIIPTKSLLFPCIASDFKGCCSLVCNRIWLLYKYTTHEGPPGTSWERAHERYASRCAYAYIHEGLLPPCWLRFTHTYNSLCFPPPVA